MCSCSRMRAVEVEPVTWPAVALRWGFIRPHPGTGFVGAMPVNVFQRRCVFIQVIHLAIEHFADGPREPGCQRDYEGCSTAKRDRGRDEASGSCHARHRPRDRDRARSIGGVAFVRTWSSTLGADKFGHFSPHRDLSLWSASRSSPE